jgi:tyrosine-protein phosphatase SIW14
VAIKRIKMMLRLFLLLVAVSMGAGCTAMKYTHGIPNLVEVAPGIWRGGQPTDEGWKYLRQELGVTNVVKLNLGKDTCAEAMGMKVTYVPISYWQSVFRPTREQIDQAVGSITSCSYIHCTHGQDRTGLVIGEYRVKVDGWSRSRAFQEMLDKDFHRSLVGLWWFWNAGSASPSS